MYAEIPRASIRFLLVKVSVMLIAPWIRGGGYGAYPPPRGVLKRCAPRPEHVWDYANREAFNWWLSCMSGSVVHILSCISTLRHVSSIDPTGISRNCTSIRYPLNGSLEPHHK
jgi:hypothetical protein